MIGGLFDIFRRNLFWWAHPTPGVGGPYALATGQLALAGVCAGNAATAGAVCGAII